MSYTITHTNGTNPIVIADGTIDTTTSITLVGRNTPSYGQYLDQNFLNMLENFSNVSQPVNPISGQLWYNSSTGLLKVYTGSVFKNISNATSGVSQPTNPQIGDFWWDTANQQLNVYTGSSWKVIGPTSIGTVVAETITDTSSITHNVISFEIGGVRYAILSKDQTFTPQAPGILGYSTISPGMNIANTSLVGNNRFVGTSTNSDSLGGVYASSFMRSDQNTSTTGILSVINNDGINVGTTGIGRLNISSNEFHLDNSQNNGIIRLRTYIGGNVTPALDVLGNADVRVNGNLFVLGNLDVVTSNESGIINGVTDSTSTTTGAFQVVGGVGIGGQLNVGGAQNTFSGNVSVGSLAIVSGALSLSTLIASNIIASNVNAAIIGNTNSNIVGLINTNAQPYITSLGTLTTLQTNGAASFSNGTVTFNPTTANKLILGSVGNIQISGGTTGQALITDGSSNLSWYTIPTPVAGGATAGQLGIYTSANTIAGNSQVTFDNSNLSVTGGLLATQDIVAYYSDQRLKTDINTIPNALEKVKKIRGVTYRPNELAFILGIGDGNEHLGVLAQEIAQVAPQVIKAAPFDINVDGTSKSGENYLTVQYDKLVPLLIEAIKELSAEIEALKARGS